MLKVRESCSVALADLRAGFYRQLLVMLEYERVLSSFFKDRPVWTYPGIRLDACATNGFLISCWRGQTLLLSFTSLAKVFVQRCSREPCDLLYMSREGGYVGGHGDFSSSAVGSGCHS